MKTTGVSGSSRRNSRTIPSTRSRPAPRARARSELAWMTGPSAIGSENGTPSSITSAPAATSACMTGTVASSEGSPAVMNGTSALRPVARSFAKRFSIRPMSDLDPFAGGDGVHVLVAPPGQVAQHQRVRRQLPGQLDRLGNGMARLQCRQDPFGTDQPVEGLQRLVVGDAHVVRAPGFLQEGVLRPDARIVQACGEDRK